MCLIPKLRLLSKNLTDGRARRAALAALAAACVFAAPSFATIKIEVSEGVEGGVPIMVFPFANEDDGDRNYSGIVRSDLAYSGLFSVLETAAGTPPVLGAQPDYDAWLARGVEKMLIGRVARGANNVIEVRFELHDSVTRRRLLARGIELTTSVSHAAHRISDLVYETLVGVPGIFNTRLAFVEVGRRDGKHRRYTLHVSDADGHNARSIYSSSRALMAPVWSPDLRRLAYVSFENGFPEIFIQTLASAERRSLGQATGPADSPDWSSDGARLAYVSSVEGNPDIYVLDLATMTRRRYTRSAAIDTEPSWGADGSLFFTSDRSGSPQIYRFAPGGGQARQLTSRGAYNSDVDVSPRGDKIAYLSARRDLFAIVIRSLTGEDEIELSLGAFNERPRFAPNGQALIYLTEHGGNGALGLVTPDGAFGRLVPLPFKRIRGIAWSPLPG